jgi:hypothetical protein
MPHSSAATVTAHTRALAGKLLDKLPYVSDLRDYPEDWLRRGVYWNEAYFLRAFLSSNNAWEIYFFNNYVTLFENYLAEKMPLCLKNIGGSLYLRKK